MRPSPMLLSPAAELPIGPEWAYEVKWDGMRTLALLGPDVRVWSRHGRDHTVAFPELAGLTGGPSVLLDGELVCLDPTTGRPSFERLMARVLSGLPSVAARQHPVTFMAFDVLRVDGADTCRLPWIERRAVLEEILAGLPSELVRLNTAFSDGAGLLGATADMGLEGVVAKRCDSRYQPGRRSPHWRKVKHRTVEWFDLLGWRAPRGRDRGDLLIGEAGKVVGLAFPALPHAERRRFADLLAEHGTAVAGGIDLPVGLAEAQVGYLERMPAHRLREPVVQAVRLAL